MLTPSVSAIRAASARTAWWVVTVLTLVSCDAFAQAPAASVPAAAPSPSTQATPLDELIKRAYVSAPSIAAQRARLLAAQAALPAAGVPSDPMIEFEYRDAGFPRQTLGSDPMSMTGASIRQPLVSKGRRLASQGVASAEVAVRHAATDATACDLTAAIRTAYAQVYQNDREQAVLRDALELASLLATTAASRYAAGASDQAAVLRAQLEVTRLGERQVDLAAERTMTVATLNRLVGQAANTPLGEVRELPPLPPLATRLDALADEAGGVAPEVAVQKANVDLAGRQLDAARAELGRTYTVGGGVYWQGGVDRVVTLTLGIELPLRKGRRQGPRIAAAEQELAAARLDLVDMQANVRAEVTKMVVEARRAESQIERYRTALLPQSSAALDAARASYLGGRGDFASVLDEFRRWTEVRTDLVRREVARFTALAQIDVLVNPIEHGDWLHDPPMGHDQIRKEGR